MKKLLYLLILVILILGGTFLFNYVSLMKPVNEKITSDSRNTGIEINVHYKNYINPSAIVIDLKKVSENNSEADVFRSFLQITEVLKTKKFDKVILAFRGTDKFMLTGDYFNKLGQEYESQNPMYTVRTFPENVLTLTGKNAYRTVEGGILGVLSEQMNQFKDFSEKWYANDLRKVHP